MKRAADPGGLLTGWINLTDPSLMGRIIVERAARYLKPCLLKLGGKAPLVVLTDGDSPGKGAIMAHVVLNRVTTDIRIYGEESFGPIEAIIRVKDTEHAIEIAHDTEYGLSAAVFGQDKRSALAVAGRIENGIYHINGPTICRCPSAVSMARTMVISGAAIDQFAQLSRITIEDPGQGYPIHAGVPLPPGSGHGDAAWSARP